MTDLIERLRARKEFIPAGGGVWSKGSASDPDCEEAADEIERLMLAAAPGQDEGIKAVDAGDCVVIQNITVPRGTRQLTVHIERSGDDDAPTRDSATEVP